MSIVKHLCDIFTNETEEKGVEEVQNILHRENTDMILSLFQYFSLIAVKKDKG